MSDLNLNKLSRAKLDSWYVDKNNKIIDVASILQENSEAMASILSTNIDRVITSMLEDLNFTHPELIRNIYEAKQNGYEFIIDKKSEAGSTTALYTIKLCKVEKTSTINFSVKL